MNFKTRVFDRCSLLPTPIPMPSSSAAPARDAFTASCQDVTGHRGYKSGAVISFQESVSRSSAFLSISGRQYAQDRFHQNRCSKPCGSYELQRPFQRIIKDVLSSCRMCHSVPYFSLLYISHLSVINVPRLHRIKILRHIFFCCIKDTRTYPLLWKFYKFWHLPSIPPVTSGAFAPIMSFFISTKLWGVIFFMTSPLLSSTPSTLLPAPIRMRLTLLQGMERSCHLKGQQRLEPCP